MEDLAVLALLGLVLAGLSKEKAPARPPKPEDEPCPPGRARSEEGQCVDPCEGVAPPPRLTQARKDELVEVGIDDVLMTYLESVDENDEPDPLDPRVEIDFVKKGDVAYGFEETNEARAKLGKPPWTWTQWYVRALVWLLFDYPDPATCFVPAMGGGWDEELAQFEANVDALIEAYIPEGEGRASGRGASPKTAGFTRSART